MKTYTKEHLWIEETADGEYRIGITEFASSQMNGIVYVEQPMVIGREYKKGDDFCNVESVKNSSYLSAPFSCELLSFNIDCLDKINDDAEGEGYICIVKAEPGIRFMDKAEYESYCS